MTHETLSAEMIQATPDAGRVSAVDRLVELIRELIAERGLRVGDALPTERELGEAYQAGRNTVREALQVLKAYGIIESRPKVGAVISGGHGDAIRKMFSFHGAVSPDSFKDVQGFRRIVEIGVADAVIRNAAAQDFAALDQKNLSMLEAATIEERAQRDYEFHEAIVELAGNRTMLGVYRMLRPVIEEIMHLGKSSRPAQEKSYEGHLELINALRAQDRIAYAYLMSRHLEYAQQFVTGEAAASPVSDDDHALPADGRHPPE